MTCAHVLGLIDAGPFAGYPRAHLDAAWQHARECGTCGPALATAMALTTDLAALPQPAPPPDLAAAVLARVARIEQLHATSDAREAANWSPWATALGTLVAAIAIVVSMQPGDGTPIPIALIVPASLALYVVGLFAPLREKRRG